MRNKGIVSKIIIEWHTRNRIYNSILLECCLDAIIQAKLQQKITYHTTKLNNFYNLNLIDKKY
jgi:hypothetical protein